MRKKLKSLWLSYFNIKLWRAAKIKCTITKIAAKIKCTITKIAAKIKCTIAKIIWKIIMKMIKYIKQNQILTRKIIVQGILDLILDQILIIIIPF